MNYTEKYHLPQWVKTDRIMMDDFNKMCADIEAGLGNAEAKAAEAAANALADANASTDEVRVTANAALEKANNAYCPTNMPYAAGAYSGNGGTITIQLGFRPRFVIVTAQYQINQGTGGSSPTAFLLFGDGMTANGVGTILDNGFSVKAITSTGDWGTNETYPFANSSGRRYAYIAFR